MIRRHVVLLAALAAAAAAALAVMVASRDTSPARPELDRILVELTTGPGRIAPGATAFVEGPQGEWTSAVGVSDIEKRTPMQPDARMRLESVSKAWTATVVLQLVGLGELRLEDTVEQWLPGDLRKGRWITMHQLLSHTSGLIDNNDIGRDPLRYIRQVSDPQLRAELLRALAAVEADPSYEFSPRLWIRFAGALPLLSEPGTHYHYSNIGYEVAAAMAAAASDERLDVLYERGIIAPLRLRSAAFDPQGEITGPHARGYTVQDDGRLVEATSVGRGGGGGAGGIVSNARDEARFLVTLMEGQLLEPPQLAALKTPPRELASSYALGLLLVDTPCGRAFTHNGGGAGFKTSVFVSDDGGRVAVLLLNGNTRDSRADAAAYSAAERLYCAA